MSENMLTSPIKNRLQEDYNQSENKIEFLNTVRQWTHEQSPLRHMPVDLVQWVPLDRVVANNYNPNAVAKNEMKLLLHSIAEDGYTQPIVTIEDPVNGVFVVVDGFHRYSVCRENKEIRERCLGMVPIVVLKKDIAERMASTVRHNRARGKHSIAGMANLVFQMLEEGQTDDLVCKNLGMEPDELLRLKHITGFAKLFENVEYRKAWETSKQLRIRKEWEAANAGNGSTEGDAAVAEEVADLVKQNAHLGEILAKLKPVRSHNLGGEKLKSLCHCLVAKDAKANKRDRIVVPSTEGFYDGNYQCFMDFFTRKLLPEKMAQIRHGAEDARLIVPNECNIESVGVVGDPSSILRLKKPALNVVADLNALGVPEHYTFVNMKLLISYYHCVHAPVDGEIVRLVPVPVELNAFGRSSVWCVEFKTEFGPVFLLLVGEYAIQDFEFSVKEGQHVDIADMIGNFTWGSQTVLMFDWKRVDVLVAAKTYCFVGKPILL